MSRVTKRVLSLAICKVAWTSDDHKEGVMKKLMRKRLAELSKILSWWVPSSTERQFLLNTALEEERRPQESLPFREAQ